MNTISAQDRKRQIRERRRKSSDAQHQKQQNNRQENQEIAVAATDATTSTTTGVGSVSTRDSDDVNSWVSRLSDRGMLDRRGLPKKRSNCPSVSQAENKVVSEGINTLFSNGNGTERNGNGRTETNFRPTECDSSSQSVSNLNAPQKNVHRGGLAMEPSKKRRIIGQHMQRQIVDDLPQESNDSIESTLRQPDTVDLTTSQSSKTSTLFHSPQSLSKASILCMSHPDITNATMERSGRSNMSCGNKIRTSSTFSSSFSAPQPKIKGASKKTLFSAVMNKLSPLRGNVLSDSALQAKPGDSVFPTIAKNHNVPIPSSPISIKTSTLNKSSKNATPPALSTPIKKSLHNRHLSPARSPGGFGLMKALDGVNDLSKAWFLENDADDGHEKKTEQNGVEEAEEAQRKDEDDDEWQDVSIQFESIPLGPDFLPNKCGKVSSLLFSAFGSKSKEGVTGRMDGENDSSEKTANHPFQSSRFNIIEETNAAIGLSDVEVINRLSYNQPVGIGVMDWALKKRIRVEFAPGGCLPGTLPTTIGGFPTTEHLGVGQSWRPPDEGRIQDLAIRHLSMEGLDGTDCVFYDGKSTTEEMAISKWMAGTMYYQHPAIHPLPSTVLESASAMHSGMPPQTTSNGFQQPKSFKSRNLSSFIRGPPSLHHRLRLPGIGCMGGLGASATTASGDATKSLQHKKSDGSNAKMDPIHGGASYSAVSDLFDQRRREWQAAFRSMFHSWRSKLKELAKRVSEEGFSGKNFNEQKREKFCRCSFYMISPGQVILFRGGLASSFTQLKDVKQELSSIVPVIVFSSTSTDLRSKLKAMGVQLKLLSNQDCDCNVKEETLFVEDLIEQKAEMSIADAEQESEQVTDELEALRKVSAPGAGAEVSVSTKKRNRRSEATESSVKRSKLQSLYVSGDDDCALVYELLLNTYGFSTTIDWKSTTKTNSQLTYSDVPLLLCRSIGPCLHTSLKSLSVSGLRNVDYQNQMKMNGNMHSDQIDETSANPQCSSFIELSGPILPCALRDLTCASVNWMLLSKHWHNLHSDAIWEVVKNGELTLPEGEQDEQEVGSHHFVMFLQSHEGEESISDPTYTGSSSSTFFNGNKSLLLTNDGDLNQTWHECTQGKFINVLVWDITRSSTLAYKNSSFIP